MAGNLRPGERSGNFDGAKAALFLGDELVVIRRDLKPWLAYAGMWDFPGGGREGDETPEETLIRETREELGLDVRDAEWLWRRQMTTDRRGMIWFFVLRLPPGTAIAFGDEGQGWALMRPDRFLAEPQAVPPLKDRLRMWLAHEKGAEPGQSSAP